MVGASDEEVRLREPKSGSRVKTNREETKRTSKEATDRWNKAGLGEIRDTKLGRKSTQSRRVEEFVGGGKNS